MEEIKDIQGIHLHLVSDLGLLFLTVIRETVFQRMGVGLGEISAEDKTALYNKI